MSRACFDLLEIPKLVSENTLQIETEIIAIMLRGHECDFTIKNCILFIIYYLCQFISDVENFPSRS